MKYHAIVILPVAETGIHSGRRRYMVACTECCQELHPATTGPFLCIARHFDGAPGRTMDGVERT